MANIFRRLRQGPQLHHAHIAGRPWASSPAGTQPASISRRSPASAPRSTAMWTNLQRLRLAMTVALLAALMQFATFATFAPAPAFDILGPERSRRNPRTHMWTAPFLQRLSSGVDDDRLRPYVRPVCAVVSAAGQGGFRDARSRHASGFRWPMGPAEFRAPRIDRSRHLPSVARACVPVFLGCDLFGPGCAAASRGQGWPQATAIGGAKRP